MKQWSRRILLVATGLTLVVALTACGSEPNPGPLAVGKDADGGSVELKRDQVLEVTLEGNQTTGYTWEIKTSGEPVVRSQGEPVYTQDAAGGSTVVGAGGTFTFTFVGAEPGTSTIDLAYQRPWENDTPPLETFTLEVTVD